MAEEAVPPSQGAAMTGSVGHRGGGRRSQEEGRVRRRGEGAETGGRAWRRRRAEQRARRGRTAENRGTTMYYLYLYQ